MTLSAWEPPVTLRVHTQARGVIEVERPTLLACRDARTISEAAAIQGSSDPTAVEVTDGASRLVSLWVNPTIHPSM